MRMFYRVQSRKLCLYSHPHLPSGRAAIFDCQEGTNNENALGLVKEMMVPLLVGQPSLIHMKEPTMRMPRD